MNILCHILEKGIKAGEICLLDINFVCWIFMGLPSTLADSEYFKDEAGMKVLTEKLFDFMKYGMLGGIKAYKYPVEHRRVDNEKKHTHES